MFARRNRKHRRVGGSGRRDAEAATHAHPPSRTPPVDRPHGPWDIGEVDADSGRVDLGGLQIPGAPGMELRVEVTNDQIVAATVVLAGGAVQLQPFAAPRTEGIWRDVRQEIAATVTQQGGVTDEDWGPLGPELRAQVPMWQQDGSRGVQTVRFVGCDGPRWFLRGVISGQAAVSPETAGLVEDVFRSVVVVRGDEPMPPREPIPLRLPPGSGGLGVAQGPGDPASDADAPAPHLDPFTRGPEITQTR
ncbi:MAG: DUF3710 domain-containing protein [Streptomycetales bacterium]